MMYGNSNENATLGNVPGMGSIVLPSGDSVGSGDIDSFSKEKKKKKKKLKDYMTFSKFKEDNNINSLEIAIKEAEDDNVNRIFNSDSFRALSTAATIVGVIGSLTLSVKALWLLYLEVQKYKEQKQLLNKLLSDIEDPLDKKRIKDVVKNLNAQELLMVKEYRKRTEELERKKKEEPLNAKEFNDLRNMLNKIRREINAINRIDIVN